jgi:spermidine synthase
VFDTPQAIGLPVKLMLAMIVVAAFLIRDRAPAFVVLCAVLTFSAQAIGARPHLIRIERGFFGVLKINLIDEPTLGPTRELIHGTTMHGAEAIDPARRCQPLVYYAPAAPIGQVFRGLEARKSALSIGAIGMGVGTVAAYVRAADRLRFFEIDPLVVGVATDPALFGYIHGCAKGPIDWVVGDARLTLAREPRDEYDLLLVDAFSSDSVPAHLLTVEAMRGYLSHIKPDGVVVLHLSNRNLELMSPVAGIARAAGGYALQQNYAASTPVLAVESSEQAVMVARTPAALAPFLSDPRWVPAQSHGVRLWTDDYTNLAGALVRRLAAVSR